MIHEIAEVIVARDSELKELDSEFTNERKVKIVEIEERYKARMRELIENYLKYEN